MRAQPTPTHGEIAAAHVAAAILHARGTCTNERDAEKLFELLLCELILKGHAREIPHREYVRAELVTEPNETLRRAVFRTVLLETRDHRMAEKAEACYALFRGFL